MIKEFTCIICPLSCTVKANVLGKKIVRISGYKCKKGKEYAITEIKSPKRVLTTTILVKNGRLPLLSVRTDNPIHKNIIFKIMRILNKKQVKAPVKIGQIIIKNILNTKSNIIATKNV